MQTPASTPSPAPVPAPEPTLDTPGWAGGIRRLGIVLAGIMLTQFVLYGPSLMGIKILLPIDILARPGIYIPLTAETRDLVPHDYIMSDMVLQGEPARQFAISELRAGRLPIWVPYQFAGCPWYRYSLCPAWLLNYCVASPKILAWSQLILAAVTGIGTYLAFRRILAVSYWPAAIGAWCFPLTGTFIIWQGCGSPPVVMWLPWLLVCVDKAVRAPWSWGGPATAVATFFTLISGALDISGQVLLTSGLYAIWLVIYLHSREVLRALSFLRLTSTCAGWAFGFMLAMPVMLPLLEYSNTGSRMIARSKGSEERPPVGIAELPQIVLPEMYGLTQPGSIRIVDGNRPESSAGAYAGFIATLLVAPLAWCNRRHRSISWFFLGIAVLGLSWAVNMPGIVQLMRLPGLNLLSHNRFVFVTSFAILALAVIGLQTLREGEVSLKKPHLLPILAVLGLLGWCLFRMADLPEPVATQLADAVVRNGAVAPNLRTRADVFAVQDSFRRVYLVGALVAAASLSGWIVLWKRRSFSPAHFQILAGLLVIELLWSGYGVNAQCDPKYYYPPVPALEQIGRATPGRFIGAGCLPASVSQTQKLRDVRGYDAIDPAKFVELIQRAAVAQPNNTPYALTQNLVPLLELLKPNTIHLHPILDMLGVRYVAFRGQVPDGVTPFSASTDYWVVENTAALPRVFVPKRVETITDPFLRLQRLSDKNFNGRDLAVVEEPIPLPNPASGEATITEEVPRRVVISAQMKTAGLLVLTDLWDRGWRAYLDGKAVPILRTNHALRGVALGAGAAKIEFRYEPRSLTFGLALAAIGTAFLLLWSFLIARLPIGR